MKNFILCASVAASACFATPAASAQSIAGTTFTTYADSDFPFCCGAFPGTSAIAGVFIRNDYDTRAISEFPLRGLAGKARSFATVSFTLTDFRVNQFPFTNPNPEPTGLIFATGYRADNLVSIVDHRPLNPYGPFGSLGTLILDNYDIGDRITLDITDSFRNAVFQRHLAYGVNLGYSGANNSFATFSDFTLTVSDVPISPIPEPETYALMLLGLGALGAVGRHRRSRPRRD